MNNNNNAFGMGIKLLSSLEAASVDLGPLAGLQGSWVSVVPSNAPANGWNVIAVPGPTSTDGFTLEVIPYTETLTFTPVVVAGNRGPIINGVQEEQNIVGLMYEQVITSVCTTDLCNKMGFGSGTQIHAETGMFLYLSNLSPNFSIARLSTIPHGNSLLALGNSNIQLPTNNDFFGQASIAPSVVGGGPFDGSLGYTDEQYTLQQFPDIFSQTDPNSFLQSTLGSSKLSSLTTLTLSTDNYEGGILNIPFIKSNINATKLDCTFWIETIAGPNGTAIDQLQYSQTINLVFPQTGNTQLIIWPHVTINTLTKTTA